MEKHRKLFRRYKAGYEVWLETSAVDFSAKVISHGADDDGEAEKLALAIDEAGPQIITRKVARTPSGKYIGNPKIAHFLCKKKGIAPETLPGHEVCSIGFCAREQKWYGWSHRAIYGFGVGDVVSEGDCTAASGWTEEYLADHPEADLSLPVGFKAESLADAKRMAIAFAESVG